ncbi:MAG: SDR family oxidoreductase [Gammaproteobacteria bacterium]|nr:SDR family oxidoreductase [Gammaproteobacteria bacterium]
MQNKSIIHADLSGKVALVTGASQGLGAFYAEVLAKNGAIVVASGRASSVDRLNAVVQRIQDQGFKAVSLVLEMTDFGSFQSKVAEIVQQFGHLDILVNNAGVSVDQDFFAVTEQSWDLHMDTNLKGLFFLSQAVAKQMKRQEAGGSMIHIAALNGEKVRKNCVAFAASKAGVLHLTKLMAYELIDYKIKVNAIQLGLFPSDAVKDWLDNDPSANDYLQRIPAKRAGRFVDLEGPLLLLASDASAYMYGTVLKVDGGFAMDVFMNLDIKNN